MDAFQQWSTAWMCSTCLILAIFSFLEFSCLSFHTRLYWLYSALWVLIFLFLLFKGRRNRYRSFEIIGNSEISWLDWKAKHLQSGTHAHTHLVPSVLTMFLVQLHLFASSLGLGWWVESRMLFFKQIYNLASPSLLKKIFYLPHQVIARIKGNNACKSSFLNYEGL